MSTPAKGRPCLDLAEVLRRKLWYLYVIFHNEMTYYQMDVAFDLDLDWKKVPENNKGKRRRKIMEELRDKNIMPFKLRINKFLNLVEKKKPGTKAIYNSYLWKLLQKKPLSAIELRKLIVGLLKKYKALQLKGYPNLNRTPEINRLLKSEFHDFSNLTDYISNLQNVTDLITNYFDKVALLGALFREAYYNMDLELAYYLYGVYINYVDEIHSLEVFSEEVKVLSDEVKVLFVEVCLSRLYTHSSKVDKSYEQLLKRNAKSTPAYNLLVTDQDGVYS